MERAALGRQGIEMALARIDEVRDFDAANELARFYENLETLLKRHQPRDYAIFATRQLDAAFGDPKKLAQFSPHHVLHSIQANCAYTRGHSSDPVDFNRFARVMNVYHGHRDPLKAGHLADEKFTLFFLAMHREQMEIQYFHSKATIARNYSLFIAGTPMPRLLAEFEAACGLTFDDWLSLCFIAAVAAHSSDSQPFHRDKLAKCDLHCVAPERVDRFLKAISRSPREIGDRFRSLREQTKPQFHSLIRSVFLGFPLMAFGDGTFLAPHWQLLLRHSRHGLYTAIKALPSFGKEFGSSVQQYVGQVLACAHYTVHMLRSSELEERSPGKSCDYLIEFPESILLVESKATSFAAERLVEQAILQDGSTGKIADGIEQLYTTAHDLGSGVFRPLGIDDSKPVIGVVVTFGEIPFANSDWYLNTFILTRAESKLKQPIYPSPNMQRVPIVMSISTLELLVMAMNSLGASLLSLCQEKDALPYITVGDWDTFLTQKLRPNESSFEPLPFIAPNCDAFFKCMGIPSPPEDGHGMEPCFGP
jgi:hypothetical protein